MDVFTLGRKLQTILTPGWHPSDKPNDYPYERRRRLDEAAESLAGVSSLRCEAWSHKLKSLRLKSCRHVFLNATTIDSQSLMSPYSWHTSMYEKDAVRLTQHYEDGLLGRITLSMRLKRSIFLHVLFGMGLGSDRDFDEVLDADIISRRLEQPASGRFSGVIEGNPKTRARASSFAPWVSDVGVIVNDRRALGGWRCR